MSSDKEFQAWMRQRKLNEFIDDELRRERSERHAAVSQWKRSYNPCMCDKCRAERAAKWRRDEFNEVYLPVLIGVGIVVLLVWLAVPR